MAVPTAITDLSATIASNAPLTLKGAKLALAELGKDPAARDFSAAEAVIESCAGSADHAEGTRAFLEKRRPVFTGR